MPREHRERRVGEFPGSSHDAVRTQTSKPDKLHQKGNYTERELP